MPISAENKPRYPADWKQIRARILERAGNRCENCGVENYAIGYREAGRFIETAGIQAEVDALDGHKLIKIVLTIAHLDHQPENCDPDNLRAWCQKCHLDYDRGLHMKSRHRNDRRAKERAGQGVLFEGEK